MTSSNLVFTHPRLLPWVPGLGHSKERGPRACLVKGVFIWKRSPPRVSGMLDVEIKREKGTQTCFYFSSILTASLYCISTCVLTVCPVSIQDVREWGLTLCSPRAPHCLGRRVAHAGTQCLLNEWNSLIKVVGSARFCSVRSVYFLKNSQYPPSISLVEQLFYSVTTHLSGDTIEPCKHFDCRIVRQDHASSYGCRRTQM